MHVTLWAWDSLERKGELQLVLQESILKRPVTFFGLCQSIPVDGLNSYQVCLCCHSKWAYDIL